jgi:hypothetical protein
MLIYIHIKEERIYKELPKKYNNRNVNTYLIDIQ